MRNLFLILVLGLFLIACTKAETTTDELLEPNITYKVFKYNFDKAGDPEIVIFLHGGSSVGNDNTSQLNSKGVQSIMAYLEKSGKKIVFLAPQCPEGYIWAGGYGDKAYINPVEELLNYYMAKENVSHEKVWLTGLSAGGRGVWKLLARHSKYYHAAFIASATITDEDSENFVGTPIMFTYGTEETTSLETFNTLANSLKSAGCQLTSYILDGLDHQSACDEAFSEERLKEFFAY